MSYLLFLQLCQPVSQCYRHGYILVNLFFEQIRFSQGALYLKAFYSPPLSERTHPPDINQNIHRWLLRMSSVFTFCLEFLDQSPSQSVLPFI